jgi:hypothetical protein
VTYHFSTRTKYKAKKTEVDGTTFDSMKEAKRYQELKILEAAGQIKDLRLQVPYELIPAMREPDTIGKRGGKIKGKLIERAVIYKADFVYLEKLDIPFSDQEKWEEVVEDVKGMRTKEYIMKRKLMLYRYGIRIREV